MINTTKEQMNLQNGGTEKNPLDLFFPRRMDARQERGLGRERTGDYILLYRNISSCTTSIYTGRGHWPVEFWADYICLEVI